MIKKVLVANRGEIAVRIIRACRDMGIETVAVFSEIDRDALHAQMADEAICIGPNKVSNSYLNMQNIISATILSNADAIHPGFGFLSENSVFAHMCQECNIAFIGPTPEAIEKMGNKSKAKEIVLKAGVPTIPGSKGAIKDSKEALKIATEIGFPVMIKASAGGGGRGMRVVHNKEEFTRLFETAMTEAKNSFGDESMYIEKYLVGPRHVEFQILADNFGNVVHLGERDCSIQRRNQKMLEESPSPLLNSKLRKEMGDAAIRAAKAVNYRNAGTIEFLVDENRRYYFIEMNTRIQVEHPVTEMVTGIDLVKEQIRITEGQKLGYKQDQVTFSGHAIECRINAENPEQGFKPCPGKIINMHIPGGPGIRVDTAVYPGYVIPPTYDSMIAKLIAYGRDRKEAICRMKRALGEFIIEGIETNIDFQMKILNNKTFIEGNAGTGFIPQEFSINN